jgi:hypothetical protein
MKQKRRRDEQKMLRRGCKVGRRGCKSEKLYDEQKCML